MTDSRSAAAVFGVLADETRIAILQAIARAQREKQPHEPGQVELTFSEIYDEAGVESTSRFSYHLKELTGLFLRKREEGYSFTQLGERLVRLIVSKNYLELSEIDPVNVAGSCPICGSTSLEARLHDQYFGITCPECESPIGSYPVTPAQIRDRDTEAIVESLVHQMVAGLYQARREVCPECSGRTTSEILEVSPVENDPFLITNTCTACWRNYNAPMTIAMAYHPASVAFHWDRGVDVLSQPMWQLMEYVRSDRWTATQVTTEPPEYEVTVRQNGDVLRFILDGDAGVRKVERVERAQRELES